MKRPSPDDVAGTLNFYVNSIMDRFGNYLTLFPRHRYGINNFGQQDLSKQCSILGRVVYCYEYTDAFFSRFDGWEKLLETTHKACNRAFDAQLIDAETHEQISAALDGMHTHFHNIIAQQGFFTTHFGDFPKPDSPIRMGNARSH